jgi:hypothetical protein
LSRLLVLYLLVLLLELGFSIDLINELVFRVVNQLVDCLDTGQCVSNIMINFLVGQFCLITGCNEVLHLLFVVVIHVVEVAHVLTL